MFRHKKKLRKSLCANNGLREKWRKQVHNRINNNRRNMKWLFILDGPVSSVFHQFRQIDQFFRKKVFLKRNISPRITAMNWSTHCDSEQKNLIKLMKTSLSLFPHYFELNTSRKWHFLNFNLLNCGGLISVQLVTTDSVNIDLLQQIQCLDFISLTWFRAFLHISLEFYRF